MIDEEDANFKCELCGCEKVRYVHVMEHNEYFEKVYVGCICAGIMEGDIIAAQERDRKMKNRAKRKLNFPHRRWKETRVENSLSNIMASMYSSTITVGIITVPVTEIVHGSTKENLLMIFCQHAMRHLIWQTRLKRQ